MGNLGWGGGRLTGFFFFLEEEIEIRVFELDGEFLLAVFGGFADYFFGAVFVVFAHTAAIFGCLRTHL
jgi:hypothetical protein